MKKLLLSTALVSMALLFASCEPGGGTDGASVPTDVVLNKVTLDVYIGEAGETLVATVFPTDLPDEMKKVTWSSDDPTTATVDDNGLVEAVKVGTATITVTTVEEGLTASCEVTVSVAPVKVNEIKLKWSSATVDVMSNPNVPYTGYTMAAEVLPEEASDRSIVWSSDNTSTATVNAETGAVAGIAVGKATITATAADGSGTKASWKVTVMGAPNLSGCDTGAPRWGSTLGEISFMSDKTWQIEGSDLIWSDAVVSSVASTKTTFMGSDQNGIQFYCDCRDGNEGHGDFFSWCAVNVFRAELCPDGWRVPSTEDFVELDIALGGTGLNRSSIVDPNTNENFLTRYLDQWGATYGGNVTTSNAVQAAGVVVYYVGQSIETNMPTYGKYMALQKYNNWIYVNQSSAKNQGMMLRCVR